MKQDEMIATEFTAEQLENWRIYEAARCSGLHNMFSLSARIQTGMSGKEYAFVMKNYRALKAEALKGN